MSNWQSLGSQPATDVALLLTDGRVMAWAAAHTSYRLITPGPDGSYAESASTTLDDLPTDGDNHAAAVMADGRVFTYGSWQPYVYDAVSGNWSKLPVPNGSHFFDAPLLVLADGRVLLGSGPQPSALTYVFDPNSGTWTEHPGLSSEVVGPNLLLKDGSVFAVSGQQAFSYSPSTGVWTPLAAAQQGAVFSVDTPALLLPDGRVVALDTGNGKFYYFTSPNASHPLGTWESGPSLPKTDSRGWGLLRGSGAMCLLPSGKVLCGAEHQDSDKVGHQALVSYELDPQAGALSEQENPDFVRKQLIGYFETPRRVSFLLLPTGQVWVNTTVDPSYSGTVSMDYLYTPSSGAPAPSWAPTFSCPTHVNAGSTFLLQGQRFNGVSQAVSHMSAGAAVSGDKLANYFCTRGAANYPIAQLRNSTWTGYLTTSHMSSMGVDTGEHPESAYCSISTDVAPGPYQLRLITNGIASDWRDVIVVPALPQLIQRELAELVILLIGGGEGGLIALTPHGVVRIKPDDPLWGVASRLANNIVSSLHGLRALGELIESHEALKI